MKPRTTPLATLPIAVWLGAAGVAMVPACGTPSRAPVAIAPAPVAPPVAAAPSPTVKAPAAPVPAPAAAAPATPSATCRPDAAKAIPSENGRVRYCAIDAGSRNVKLIVTSLGGGDRFSFKNERQCRARLQLGEKTFDQKTGTARPLGAADRDALVRVVNDYAALCQHDGGRMLGGIATEWARRATNKDEIQQALAAGSAMASLDIIPSEQEARFGYLAATRGVPGKIVLDFGSRSVQLSFWPRGAPAPEGASLPLGIDESGDRFFNNDQYGDYAAARAAFVAQVRSQLYSVLARIRRAIAARTLGPELFSLGENGDVALALKGELWDSATRQGIDENTYGARIKAMAPVRNVAYGMVTAVVAAKDLAALANTLERDAMLFRELRGARARRIYGNKMLVFPALVTLLAKDLGIDKVVLVPQEMADGLIVEKLTGDLR